MVAPKNAAWNMQEGLHLNHLGKSEHAVDPWRTGKRG